jgi:hypothetical protein
MILDGSLQATPEWSTDYGRQKIHVRKSSGALGIGRVQPINDDR